jgi:hypothetical protein
MTVLVMPEPAKPSDSDSLKVVNQALAALYVPLVIQAATLPM